MKILALDIGDARIGVAIGDSETKFVFPRDHILNNKNSVFTDLQKILKEDNISLILVGLPLNHDGSESGQSTKIKNFVKNLEQKVDIKISYENEYGTSLEAKQRFKHISGRTAQKKGTIDSIAASLILESYFSKNEE